MEEINVKIATAEEFWDRYSDKMNDIKDINHYCPIMLREFAELHVTQALKQASENAQLFHEQEEEYYDYFDDPSGNIIVAKDTILESYPLTNIE